MAAMNQIASRHAGQTVVVVTHSGPLRVLVQHAPGLDARRPRMFGLPNASINRFSASDGHWMLRTWGETAHLRGLRVLDDD
jgi:probable phosphoglycerate mutase